MTNAYDAWKAAKIGTELDILPGINEGIHAALTLAEAALREPAKKALVDGLLASYAAHVRGDVDEHDDGYREEDFTDRIVAALAEFNDPTPPTPVMDKVPTAALDALKTMESLNYTGEHTHFEVLADARQVLAAVMMGKAMPKLERFRCPSLRTIDRAVGQLRCVLQLPHPGPHTHEDYTWDDAHSDNPPKSYNTCDDKHTFKRGVLAGKTYTCAREAGHTGQHESKGRSKWA